MKNKERILNLLDVLIATERVRDSKEKKDNSKLSGESAMLFHLKRLKEMIIQEL